MNTPPERFRVGRVRVGRVRVGRIGPDEWASYREVRLAALADTPLAFSSSLERERAFDEETWRGRLGSAATFLAWREGAPAGTVTVLPYDESQRHGVSGAAHLVAMWVTPDARRLGIGRQLVEAVFGEARAMGAPAVVLWVFEDNDRARGLYEEMGFRATELRDSPPDRPEDAEILMVRELA